MLLSQKTELFSPAVKLHVELSLHESAASPPAVSEQVELLVHAKVTAPVEVSVHDALLLHEASQLGVMQVCVQEPLAQSQVLCVHAQPAP